MKQMTIEEFSELAPASLAQAQREKIVIFRKGKPYALVTGIKNWDEEDWAWASSPEFWRMIRKRRAEKSVPLVEAEARLFKKK